MITKISIKNFKSLKDNSLQLSNLNLFTGVNASGKSTFLQALILLKQSYPTLFGRKKSLYLGDKDSLVNLGVFNDVFYEYAAVNESLSFEVETAQTKFSFTSEILNTDNKGDINIRGNLFCSIDIDEFILYNNRIEYLAADRIQPQEAYPRFRGDENLGKDGAFAAHYLEKYGNKSIPIPALLHKYTKDGKDTLQEQVNYWLQSISPNIEVVVEENTTTNKIELYYRYFNKDIRTQKRKPQNVGYGITPTLPILVALLSAKQGDIIIIENPETHIHPKGQTELATLMAIAAQNGVQILVESHSDHILNGIRVAARKKKIDTDKIKINYFIRNGNDPTIIKALIINEKGRINEWPKGFFDEWDNMLDELI